MALEGSLKEFGLADILQLLYFQKKTGALVIEGRFDRIKILFKDGNIVAIESRRRLESNRLGRILIKKGLITQAELDELLKQQPLTGLRLGEMLVQKGVSPEVITESLTKQMTETLIQILQWKEGYYEFKPEGVSISKELAISLDTQHMLMEGLRVLDEYSLIGEKVSPDMVFKISGEIPEDLQEKERQILELINGENELSTIVELSGMEEIEVSRIILRLLEAGIIREKKAEEFIVPPPEEEKRFIPPLAPFIWLLTAACLVFSVSWFFHFKNDLKKFRAIKEIEAIALKLEFHKIEKANYPEPEDFPTHSDPWGSPYVYRLLKSEVPKQSLPVILSNGPDRSTETEDDIY
ncbi:MAG: DUF4388 domain-containing protein [Thermodesulfovibrionales bacterium]|nr:DUF4388 domain-containing protein [Thermodesulfovibrionales bacterium]